MPLLTHVLHLAGSNEKDWLITKHSEDIIYIYICTVYVYIYIFSESVYQLGSIQYVGRKLLGLVKKTSLFEPIKKCGGAVRDLCTI